MQDVFKIVKEARIDDLYLSSIGYDSSKNKGCCPIHGGVNKNGFSYTDKKGYRQYSCWTKGCIGQGVDIIEVCKVKENLADRYEAVKYLANIFNIELPTKEYTKEEKAKFEQIKKQQKEKAKNIFKIEKAIENSKSFDRKFILSSAKDNIEAAAETEIINYANYKANEVYQIDDKISKSNNSSVVNLLLMDNEKTLMIAPPNSGKSYSVIENAKRFNMKMIFVLPLVSNAEQTANSYGVPGVYGNIDLLQALEKSNIVICTWNKLQQLKDYDLSEYKIVLDEIHQIYTDRFREAAIDEMLKIVDSAKSRLDITATATMLDFEQYDYIVEYKPTKKIKKEIKYYDSMDSKSILDVVNNPNNKSMVLINNKTMLDTLAAATTQKYDVINSDNKHTSDLYNLLMTNSTMGDYKVLYHTTTLLASYNINDEDITDIIVYADKELKNISSIIQDITRPRKVDKIRVHIFGNFKDECTVKSIEWTIRKDISKWSRIAAEYNEDIKEEFTTFKLNVEAATPSKGYIYFDKDLEEYKVDKVKIRADLYNYYYMTRTLENHSELLKEYLDPKYDTIEFITNVKEQQPQLIKDNVKAKKEAKIEALEKLEKNKDILVGYNEIMNDNISYKLHNYLLDIRDTAEGVAAKYTDDINKDIKNNNLDDTIKLYTDYVLDYKYTYDVAWKLANMHHNTRTHKFINPIKNIIYGKVKELYPGEIIDTIDNKVYNYIVDNIKPGMSYTKEHIELLSQDLIGKFKDDKKYSVANTRKILNEIFNISNKPYAKGTLISLVNILFYINTTFTTEIFNKLTRVYTIENLKLVDDVKKELQISNSDKSIEAAIQLTIDKIIAEYDNNKQLENELMKDLFNIC